MISELNIIEQKDLREQFIDRIDVLNKVKDLLLLPNTNCAITQQVADYYEVPIKTIYSLLFDNNEEITSDGYKVYKANDFKTFQKEGLKILSSRGYFELEFSNGSKERFSPRGVGLFPRRAILRVGMLLRDSDIAKEVRTQLLNIEGKTTSEQKIQEINQEQRLVLNIVYGKDDIERANATRDLLDYKNRYINTLEDKIDSLVTGILTWNAREGINRMVRKIATKIFDNKFAKAWDKVYAEMLYKHNIGVTKRIKNSKNKKATIFDVLSESEIKLLVKSCLSLCEMYKINVEDLFMDIKEEI